MTRDIVIDNQSVAPIYVIFWPAMSSHVLLHFMGKKAIGNAFSQHDKGYGSNSIERCAHISSAGCHKSAVRHSRAGITSVSPMWWGHCQSELGTAPGRFRMEAACGITAGWQWGFPGWGEGQAQEAGGDGNRVCCWFLCPFLHLKTRHGPPWLYTAK